MQLVMEHTGHRSIEGIRSYKRTSMKQKEVVSDILTNTKKQHVIPVINEESMAIATQPTSHYRVATLQSRMHSILVHAQM